MNNSQRIRGSLALLQIPFIFTQDDLLTTEKFVSEAKDRGHRIDLDTLQALHVHNLLAPLFRVSDTAVVGRRIKVDIPITGNNSFGWVVEAARAGRLRDPAEEGYSVALPYRRPEGTDHDWWNGFIYSSWQLLDLGRALTIYSWVQHGIRDPATSVTRDRQRFLALAALSPRYLSGVLGWLRTVPGSDEDAMWRFRSEASALDLLQVVDYDPAQLKGHAEGLLGDAHDDPLTKLLPLLRHMSYKGWSQLRGEPLDAMWKRVGAEVLLRAHEDLARAGHVKQLPDLTGETWWTVLHDRLSARHEEAETLERALGDFGLSPYPRVILLVEGETELLHTKRLLAEIGFTKPQQVRVQRAKGSKASPHLIARYGVTPRVGRRLGDRWLLDATPTALVVATDAENRWATPEQRERERLALLEAIREEVRSQGADIGHDYLDFLVAVHVWGADSYELANFTDDELVPAISRLAAGRHDAESSAWQQELRSQLETARAAHDDVKVVLGRMKLGNPKVRLAEELWPLLRTKFEREWTAGEPVTPVVKLIADVRRIYHRISGIRAMVVPDGFNA
ncbi:hypothetical protein ACGFJ4_16565 [Micromonospora chalcea]|uniref:hypothetical protein n=1 Tax=Micromonospora chalcea TaxID=1874 RepID=UPI0037108FB5